VIREGLFIGCVGLCQVASVDQNPHTTSSSIGHKEGLSENGKFATVRPVTMAQTDCKKCGREYIYNCCDGPVCMPCPHCGFDESDPEPLLALNSQQQTY